MTARRTTPLLPGIGFAEGLRWHDGELWWSDMALRTVDSLEPGSAPRGRGDVAGQPSGLGFRPDGTPLVVSMYDRYLLAIDGDSLVPVADLSPSCGGPCNDMHVDKETGRAYISGFGFPLFFGPSGRKPWPLLMVSPDGTAVSHATEPLEAANGMAMSPDGRTLVVAESGAHRLSVFDVAGDGTLSGRRTYADLGEHGVDGICMDVEGAIWVSDFRGFVFVRVDATGAVTDVVETGGRLATTCILGGDDMRTLFCATADGPPYVPCKEPGGAIETVKVDVPGF